ncbi:MAG TPA: VWA domain-containing protein [Spirochaetota bacterium]|nr:VWA domain-containing protein [Spirochaetota bacterium]HPF06685.1 VWA domain-containing protein [Spirochaetota bacterium]HPJ41742.1 VWA domain-containing protein [Spirochaetota bacterium]HPR36653.1 VWA domain-containing protein [Spirochaetota bacterium]HRX47718.1 VWA domain-containing protein [Spirochaetota bacterium]
MRRLIAFVLILLTATCAFSATIAVVPYRVDHPLEKITGRDYSKLLSLGILLMKNIEVSSPEEVEIAMQQTGVKPEGAISGEDLHAIGLKCRADYVLIGTIRKIQGVYQFENVLFSVKGNSVLSRNSNRARDLYSIVHQEIKDTLVSFSEKKTSSSKGSADIAFLTDMSYSMSTEWPFVRGAITDFSAAMISRYGIDTRIYIIPYSDKRSFESATVHHNSIKELRERLNSLSPSGTADTKNFLSALNYSLVNIKWRRDASKQIIVINNSKTDSLFLAEKYSADAKRREIRIHTISGGRTGSEFSDAERLADLTGGLNYTISYHQRVHDRNGGKHEIYMQRGRVFHSLADYPGWREGILASTGKNPKYVRTPASLDEIYQNRINPWPEKLVQVFSASTGIEVMEKNPVQSNIGDIIASMRENFFNISHESFSGKALISDGRLSMWVKVKDPGVMRRLEMNSEKGFFIKCGFQVRTASNDAYGVNLTPVTAEITSDYITDFVKTDLTEIVKNKDYFTSKGIGKPPTWFIDVKIENTERYDLKPDVRD